MKLPDIIRAKLSQQQPGKWHDDLLQDCKDLMKLSRDAMSKKYGTWDAAAEAYKARKAEDTESKKSQQKGGPKKLAVPLTHEQVGTFVAFQHQVLTQRPHFYELGGVGGEDEQIAELAEAVLEHSLTFSKFKGVRLKQFLKDVGRFGMGVLKDSWDEKFTMVEQQAPINMAGNVDGEMVYPPTQMQMVPKITFQGTKVVNVSPYRFFPDPRVPLTELQDGEFCGDERDMGRHELRLMQKNGYIAGEQHIKKLSREILEETNRRSSFSVDQTSVSARKEQESYFIITEIQRLLIPSEILIDNMPLGKEEYPVKYQIIYANDDRIIRIAPMNYLHDEFTYSVGEYDSDMHELLSHGLPELLEQLQDVQNWYLNSHIQSVRAVVGNKLLVDPRGIEAADLANNSPILRLKPSAQGSGVDRWIKQLQVQDVTQGHTNDAGIIGTMARQATGITETLLGQAASGRRSATEMRNVSTSAAARQLLISCALWETAFLPLGRRMVSNARDGMDVQQLVSVVGMTNAMKLPQGIAAFVPVDKNALRGTYDFVVFDGTTPSMRQAVAAALQEVFIKMNENPQLAFFYDIDPQKLFRRIMQYRGIPNLEQFSLGTDGAQRLVQMAQFANNAMVTGLGGAAGVGQTGNGPNVRPS